MALPANIQWHLRTAVSVLRRGGIIAYPTEAVYGLGCLPQDQASVLDVIAIKRRSVDQGLILIAADSGQIAPFVAPLDAEQEKLLRETWPGPLTWIVPAAPDTPLLLTGGRDTIAVRVTAHPVAAALCRAAGTPLVSTSANRSGRPPARTALGVRQRFGADIDYILTGPTGGARKPTEIRELGTGRKLRSA